MEYYRILNLKREPFSNSPEPEFFFQSPKHLGCLQNLEMSIRLKRGLNVVIGDVGTGKTTLCRQLIIKLSEREEDRKEVETHLVMDPSFGSAMEFLSFISAAFGLSHIKSERLLKEQIKNYLFTKGVNENKTVLLIIDEGQKLPYLCLEILREFLNYETNDHKLLQIVIFAQGEFKQIIQAHDNIADRINLCYYLKPLNFRETKQMIDYRLQKASCSLSPPALFSLAGLWAIYRITGGYPRKIITLCHQVVLALIIQNRSKAGRTLVKVCAKRNSPAQINKKRWMPVTVTVMIIAGLTAAGASLHTGNEQQKSPEINNQVTASTATKHLPDQRDVSAAEKSGEPVSIEKERTDETEKVAGYAPQIKMADITEVDSRQKQIKTDKPLTNNVIAGEQATEKAQVQAHAIEEESMSPLTLSAIGPSSVKVGGEFTLDMHVTDADNLESLHFLIVYAPGSVTFLDAEEGAFMNTGAQTSFSVSNDAGNGRVVMELSRVSDRTGASGEGTIASARFRAEKSGKTNFYIFNVKPKGPAGHMVNAMTRINNTSIRIN